MRSQLSWWWVPVMERVAGRALLLLLRAEDVDARTCADVQAASSLSLSSPSPSLSPLVMMSRKWK